MSESANAVSERPFEHNVSGPPPVPPGPIADVEPGRRLTPAEEARTLLAGTNIATLGSLSSDGYPWASLVAFGSFDDGSPVLCISTLAEHRRNLEADDRASLMVAAPGVTRDPLAGGRVSLAGRARLAEGDEEARAREAHISAVPQAAAYADFGDFAFWVLGVERVRWVGGYGRMDSVDAESYAAAEPDPVVNRAGFAVRHLNDDHPDALLAMAQALGGHPDATAARCTGADRYGLDLWVDTPRGGAPARVHYAEPINEPDGMRSATVELARRSRSRLA
jgi:putative heme iron utilization protein